MSGLRAGEQEHAGGSLAMMPAQHRLYDAVLTASSRAARSFLLTFAPAAVCGETGHRVRPCYEQGLAF